MNTTQSGVTLTKNTAPARLETAPAGPASEAGIQPSPGSICEITCRSENSGSDIEFFKGLSDYTYLGATGTEYPSKPAQKGQVNGKKFDYKKYITEVRGVEVYASTVVVKRHAKLTHEHEHKRKEILNLGEDSLARPAFVVFNTPAHFPSMMTLTYPTKFTNEGDPVKRDLNRLLVCYRRSFSSALYLWWLRIIC